MGTKYISNARNRVADPPTSPPAPSPMEAPQPEPQIEMAKVGPKWYLCACGCGGQTKRTYCRGHYPRNRKGKATLRPVMSTKLPRKGDGVGLYACENCRWYSEARPLTTKEGCEATIPPRARPCQLHRYSFGYFEPVELPTRVTAVDVTQMDLGELLILQWAARDQVTKMTTQKISQFKVDDRVKYLLNGQWHRGRVKYVNPRSIMVIGDHDSQILRKIHEVEPDPDPPAGTR